MKIVLVNPPYSFWKSEYQYLSRVLGCTPPLGLLSLATYARRHVPDVDVTIIDAPARGLTWQEAAHEAVAANPALIGVTVTTQAYPIARRMAERMRQALPDTCIAFGGPHVSGSALEVIRDNPAVDCAVFGEGEQTFVELLERVAQKESLVDLPGTVSRDADGAPRAASSRAHFEDLDDVPSPDFELLQGYPSRYPSNVFFSPGGPMATLSTSRGCPFGCRFCDQSTFGRRYRAWSPERVVETVASLRDVHGVRYVNFCDDTFTMHRDRLDAICDGLAQLHPSVAWTCDANVMTLDGEALRAMKRAGCWGIAFGIESGSQRVLDSLNKQIRIEKVAEVVRLTREAGIHAKGLFMMGTPEESRETIEETRAFLSAIPLTTINVSKYAPYPGTELAADCGDLSGIPFELLNGMHFVVPSRYLAVEELEREYDATLRHFYGQWRVRLGYVPLLFGNPGNVWRIAGLLPRLAPRWTRRRFLNEAKEVQ
ncbi:MAG: radical SAM protein [bacterium]|nr:radical SAM protein [bacterium]